MWDLILLGTLTFVLWWIWSHRLPPSFPPGPRFPIPVLGDALSLGKNVTLGAKYGDVIGMYLGKTPTVVICDFDLIQEAMAKDAFSDRPNPPAASLVRIGKSVHQDVPGVIFSSGQTWMEQRRFALSTLRDFGYGKQDMEDIVAEEVSDLLAILERDYQDKPIVIGQLFNILNLNSLWRLTTSEKLDSSDPKLQRLTRILDKFFKEIASPMNQVAGDYYWLMFLLTRLGLYSVSSSFKAVFDFVGVTIKEHRHTYQEDNMRDLIDCYIREQRQAPTNSSFHGKYGDSNLANLMLDFFLAGSETTSNTLSWAVLFMANYPEVQARVQQEIDQVTGGARIPRMQDRMETPFTEATLLEIQRRSDIVPLAVPHIAKADATIGQYQIPAGTQVFPFLGAVHSDPGIFPEPDKFLPDRYLMMSKDGPKKFTPHPKVIPFGSGKRRCLGENLARMSLYKFYTGLLQRFEVSRVDPSGPLLDETPVFGATQSPRPYKVILKLRT